VLAVVTRVSVAISADARVFGVGVCVVLHGVAIAVEISLIADSVAVRVCTIPKAISARAVVCSDRTVVTAVAIDISARAGIQLGAILCIDDPVVVVVGVTEVAETVSVTV
jgi:hypothetical protein